MEMVVSRSVEFTLNGRMRMFLRRSGKKKQRRLRTSVMPTLKHPGEEVVIICMMPKSDFCIDSGPVVLRRGYADESVAFRRILPPEDYPDYFPPFRFPIHLIRAFGYIVACIDAKLYFVGGHNVFPKVSFTHVSAFTPGERLSPEEQLPSLHCRFNRYTTVYFDDVSVFDLLTYCWEADVPCMQKPRSSPAVVTHMNALYVFGSQVSNDCREDFSLSPDTFAEYYNTRTRKWSYIISPAPLTMLSSPIISHSYSESKGLVYFWVYCEGIFSYDFTSQSWSPFITKECWKLHPTLGLIWSDTAVLLDSFLIWHNFGVIYYYSFSDDTIKPLYKFKKASRLFSRIEDTHYPLPSYLLNVGNGILYLVHGQTHRERDINKVLCHKFDLSTPDISLTHKGCEVYNLSGYGISSVCTMNEKLQEKISEFA